MTIGDNTGTVGDRTPALWIHKTRGVYIVTTLNAVASVGKFFKTKKPALNEWSKVEISQVKIGQKYFFSLAIKGETLWFVENRRPKEFTDVMVFASSDWYAAQDGSIRQFAIENKKSGKGKMLLFCLNTSNFSFDARFECLECLEWMYKKSDSVNNGLLHHSRISGLSNFRGKAKLCLSW